MGSTPKITVLLADDHRLVRLGFRRILEDEPDIAVVGEAGNGLEAIALAEQLRPTVAVIDISMPELDGVQAIHEIGRRASGTRVLVLSMYDERSYVRNAFQAGARGYVLKNAIDVDLVSAVKAVAAGQRFLSAPLSFEDIESSEPGDLLERLTQRERQVLQLIAQAHSNKEIAGLLNISVNTVNVHRTNLMHSLNLHSTAELVLFAVQKGLITLPK